MWLCPFKDPRILGSREHHSKQEVAMPVDQEVSRDRMETVSLILKETACATPHGQVHRRRRNECYTGEMYINPSLPELNVSSLCSVRWSDRKIYNATVLAMVERGA